MRKIVFDIETSNFFDETGSNDPASLTIACVCIHDSETDTYSSYRENELGKLWPILDTLAAATLGRKKTADGLAASRWWKEGAFQKVIDYCIEDVKITKEIYEYALTHGHLKYRDGDAIKEIPLDTSDWEKISPGPTG